MDCQIDEGVKLSNKGGYQNHLSIMSNHSFDQKKNLRVIYDHKGKRNHFQRDRTQRCVL